MSVGEDSLQSATVMHNTFTRTVLAIDLWMEDAEVSELGATIALNDFADWQYLSTGDDFGGIGNGDFVVDLSAMEQGNHWGIGCDEGVDGFPYDPMLPQIQDSFANGEPVANLRPHELRHVVPCSLAAGD